MIRLLSFKLGRVKGNAAVFALIQSLQCMPIMLFRHSIGYGSPPRRQTNSVDRKFSVDIPGEQRNWGAEAQGKI